MAATGKGVIELEDAVATVIEIKLVKNDEDSKPCLAELKSQLLNAHSLFPNADLLGVKFFAAAPVATPSFEKAIERLRGHVSSLLPEAQGFTRVPGHRFAPIFEQVSTEFYCPAMSVSLTPAGLQYAPTVEYSAIRKLTGNTVLGSRPLRSALILRGRRHQRRRTRTDAIRLRPSLAKLFGAADHVVDYLMGGRTFLDFPGFAGRWNLQRL